MQSYWTHAAAWKKCMTRNYRTIGEFCISTAIYSAVLHFMSQEPHIPATIVKTIISSYVKGGWSTKNEGLHERITGNEGPS